MESERPPVHLAPGAGRRSEMGRINAVFKADGPETADRYSFVLAPGGGTPHDFENRTGERAGPLNFSASGPFEPHMAGIVEWFRGRDA